MFLWQVEPEHGVKVEVAATTAADLTVEEVFKCLDREEEERLQMTTEDRAKPIHLVIQLQQQARFLALEEDL